MLGLYLHVPFCVKKCAYCDFYSLPGRLDSRTAYTEAVLREAALARLAAGECAAATDLASRLVRQNPLDEDYQVLLVRCLAAAGDGVGAARQASACRELFLRELGVPPGAALDAAMHTTTATPTNRLISVAKGQINLSIW